MLKDFQMIAMVQLQDKINSLINKDWVVAQNKWMLAGAMELAEGIDHHGWKWWKNQTINLKLLQNELIDYWHFVLSQSMVYSEGDLNKAFYFLMPNSANSEESRERILFDGSGYIIAEMSTVDKMFLLIGLAASKRFEYFLFESVMQDLELSWSELYVQYVGKNVLNIFRQDHGYKTNEYKKEWFGREDNCFMIESLELFSDQVNEPDFQDVLYKYFENMYSSWLAEVNHSEELANDKFKGDPA